MKNSPMNSKDSSDIRLGETVMFKFLYSSWKPTQYNFELKETKLLVMTGKDVKTKLSQFVSSTVASVRISSTSKIPVWEKSFSSK